MEEYYILSYQNISHKNYFFNIIETGTVVAFLQSVWLKPLDRKKDGKIFTVDILPHNKKITIVLKILKENLQE